jgi:hypothetical protein
MPGSRSDIGAALLRDAMEPAAGAGPGAGGAGGGLSVQAFADLSARIGQVADGIATQNNRTQALWRAIRPIPGIPVPPITTSSGLADYAELLSPRMGYWWFVIQAAAVTFTAGTVNLYRGQANLDSLLVGAFTAAGYLTYSSTGLPVPPGSRLIFAAQAVTGNVTPSLSTVIEVADWAVPAYLT